jgi:hypothetical protein
MQHHPLTGQQSRGHGLGQQRMPGPMSPLRRAGSQQPGRGQFLQPAAHRIHIQPGDVTQQAFT